MAASATFRTMGGAWMSFNHWDKVKKSNCKLALNIMAEGKDPTLFSKVTVYSLLACVAQFALGFVFAQKWGNKCSAVDRWVLVWLFYDAIVHFTLVSTDVHAGTFTVWPVCNSSPLAAWPCRRDPSSTCHSLEMWQLLTVYWQSYVGILCYNTHIVKCKVLFFVARNKIKWTDLVRRKKTDRVGWHLVVFVCMLYKVQGSFT